MISVCIASHNGGTYIKKQLESVLSQLSPNDEIIISDDGSSDNTIEVIASINDSRIKVYTFSNSFDQKIKDYKNHQLAANNFENALSKAQGDNIYLCDQDDIWYENKVSVIQSLFHTTDLVLHNYSLIDESDTLILQKFDKKCPVHASILMNVLDNQFKGCCMAFKRSFLKYCLPFPKNVIGHDYWLGILIRHYGSFTYYAEPLLYYRRNPVSVSQNINRKLYQRIWFRISLMKKVIIRLVQNRKELH